MSLLRNDNILFYHPLDDTTEYIKDHVWDYINYNFLFSGGIIVSGIVRKVVTSTEVKLAESLVDGGYTDIDGATRFTTCVWASGYYQDNSYNKYINIGFEDATIGKNTIRLRKDTSNNLTYTLVLRDITVGTKTISSRPNNSDWNFAVIDAEKEDANWRFRISFNGADWQDLGTATGDYFPNSNNRTLIYMADTSSDRFIIDEVVVWKDAELFTSEELSNLYELANTYSKPMSQYGSVFGTPISSGIDCFINGSDQTSGNASLYIPGQKEAISKSLFLAGLESTSGNVNLYIFGIPPTALSSIDLYILVPTPISGDFNSFIYGYQTSSDGADQYIQGYSPFSGNIDLYISGVPAISSSIGLYTIGPIPFSGNVDNFTWGHLQSSGNCSLFTKGLFPVFDAFVSTVSNNPSSNVNLFTHGVPSGIDTVFYTNDSATLFIEDQGDKTTVNNTWPSFVRVDDAIATGSSGVWKSFVKCGNTANDNVSIYINSHASGESPRGTQITNYGTMIIAGLGEQLFDGYSVANSETHAFAKVHLGLNDNINMYISGTIAIVPPSSSLDLFIFGIIDTQSDSNTLYAFGRENVNDRINLFTFGIQDVQSGLVPLYIKVTNIGSLSKQSILYSHGF